MKRIRNDIYENSGRYDLGESVFTSFTRLGGI
jgi:hypothetical protein